MSPTRVFSLLVLTLLVSGCSGTSHSNHHEVRSVAVGADGETLGEEVRLRFFWHDVDPADVRMPRKSSRLDQPGSIYLQSSSNSSPMGFVSGEVHIETAGLSGRAGFVFNSTSPNFADRLLSHPIRFRVGALEPDGKCHRLEIEPNRAQGMQGFVVLPDRSLRAISIGFRDGAVCAFPVKDQPIEEGSTGILLMNSSWFASLEYGPDY